MATTFITVDCKLFQMMPYIIISQKVSSTYWKPFQHSKVKTCRGGGHNVPPQPEKGQDNLLLALVCSLHFKQLGKVKNMLNSD